MAAFAIEIRSLENSETYLGVGTTAGDGVALVRGVGGGGLRRHRVWYNWGGLLVVFCSFGCVRDKALWAGGQVFLYWRCGESKGNLMRGYRNAC